MGRCREATVCVNGITVHFKIIYRITIAANEISLPIMMFRNFSAWKICLSYSTVVLDSHFYTLNIV